MSRMLSTAMTWRSRVAAREPLQLADDAGGALAAEGHRRAVQPAERAVRLDAPPAAPRVSMSSISCRCGTSGLRRTDGEVLVVVRRRQGIQVDGRFGAAAVDRFGHSRRRHDAADPGPGLPGRERVDQAPGSCVRLRPSRRSRSTGSSDGVHAPSPPRSCRPRTRWSSRGHRSLISRDRASEARFCSKVVVNPITSYSATRGIRRDTPAETARRAAGRP